MTAELLFAELSRISEAPGAIPRLRRFVLDLAVRGRLTRHAEHESGAVGEADSRRPWKVPRSWRFVPLKALTGGAGIFKDGDWVESKDQDPSGDVRLTQLADVGVGTFRDRSSRFMRSSVAARLHCTYLETGDVLIARMPDPIGRACLFPGASTLAVTVVDVAILRPRAPGVSPEYAVHAINSPSFNALVMAHIAGTTRQRISRANLSNLSLPLPPITEQYEITAKVDELLALCDEMEAARAERERRRDRFTVACLTRLSAPTEDATATRITVSACLSTLAVMTARPDQVSAWRESILDVAVAGRFITETDTHEAGHNFGAMPRVRGRHVDRGRVNNRQRQLPMRQILDALQTGPFGSSLHQSDYQVGGTPVINPASIRNGRIVPVPKLAVGPDVLERLATFRLKKGSIIMARRGEMGRCAVVTEVEQGWLCGTGSLVLTVGSHVDPYYLAMLIGAPAIRKFLNGASVGTTMQNLNQGILFSLTLPVPAVEEQRFVVAKVDQLMAVCDELERSLTEVDHLRARTLEAVLAGALEPAA